MSNELYGQDILLDDNLQAVVAANGDMVYTTGVQTVIQDIKLRLLTPMGSLFYDCDFGSGGIEFIKDENTLSNRLALAAEVERQVNKEQRVVVGSARAEILSWDHKGVSISVNFNLIDEDHPFNLVILAGQSDKLDMVIKDVSTY